MEVIPWIAVFILAVMLVLYIYYLRHKKAADTATSRFAKWGTVGYYVFAALLFGAGFYVFAQSEPDFSAALREHWLGLIICSFCSIVALVRALIHAVRPDRPRAPDDANVSDIR